MRWRTLAALGFVGVFGMLAPGRVAAQQYAPPAYGSYGRGGPALSPYLNMTRGGNPAANYFLGVLPEIDRRRTKVEQGREITDLELRSDVLSQQQQGQREDIGPELTGGGLLPSGHAAAFTAYGAYYGLAAPSSPASRLQTTQTRGR